MEFNDIISKLQDQLTYYKERGIVATLEYDSFNYHFQVGAKDRYAVIRDGRMQEKGANQELPSYTSFDNLFIIEGATYLNYVSDYPLAEYGERLNEVFVLIEAFFRNDYTITSEKFLFFKERKYLNIPNSKNTVHLLETRPSQNSLSMNTSHQYIFADKNEDGTFTATELHKDLDTALNGLEYGDVAEGKFQIWEYPSGTIYDITVDREVPESNHYSTSLTSNGQVWAPKLAQSHTDKEIVASAVERLKS